MSADLVVPEIGDEHPARRVSDAERTLAGKRDRLRRDPTCPEHWNLPGLDRHRVTVIRLLEIPDAELFRRSHLHRRAMHPRKARGYLDCLRDERCGYRTHAHHQRPVKAPGALALHLGAIHRNSASQLDMAQRESCEE